MTRIWIGLMTTSVLALGGWWVGVGYSFEWLSFALGIGIFVINLGLWTIVVRGVLQAAAEAALARQEEAAKICESTSAVDKEPDSIGVSKVEETVESDAEVSKSEVPSSRRPWLLMVAMVVKMTFFAGGIYLCLAHWYLSPLYFVGGLIAGLMLTSVCALAS